MFRNIFIFIQLLLAGMISAAELSVETPLNVASLSQLEHRLEEIDLELENLANYGLGSGIGPIGYRSIAFSSNNVPHWINIDFQQEFPLDEIMLVPAIRRNAREGFKADGFPEQFRIIAGNAREPNGIVVAEYSSDADILPRIAPLVIPCNGIQASWIRIETQRLGQRGFDNAYVVQFSEIIAFSGEENVALRKKVTCSLGTQPHYSAWGKEFIVDGIVPYIMDAANGEQSEAYLTPAKLSPPPALTLDLEDSYPISRIHLHAVGASDTLPQAFAGDIGIPKHLRVEGANQADFSDAVVLLDLHNDTIYDIGPIMAHCFPETPCRYVRFSVIEPAVYPLYGEIEPRLGFSEIEIFSNGRNVARTKKTTTSFNRQNPYRLLEALTDGRNIYGNILPFREWLNQLAMRHHLETERPHVAAELSQRYARQKINLYRVSWLAVLLAGGIGFTFLIGRLVRLQQVAHIKERFAADLHDELSANIHTIGMLCDLAQDAESSDEWSATNQQIWDLTKRTDTAIRHCANILEAKGLYMGLVIDMKRAAQRIFDNFEHTFTIEGEPWIDQLNPHTSVDLFLFYKECLINICRHSKATHISTQLTATPKKITLTVTDNGTGINIAPSSLERRARLLKAKLCVNNPAEGGTNITLQLRTRRIRMAPKPALRT